MDDKSYDAIKLKIELDKNAVYKEIAILQQKRMAHQERLQKEVDKLNQTTHLLGSGSINSAMLKRPSYQPDVVIKEKAQMEVIEGYIKNQSAELEKVNERERLIDEMYQENLKEKQKKERKQEEEALIEMKIANERRNQGGE